MIRSRLKAIAASAALTLGLVAGAMPAAPATPAYYIGTFGDSFRTISAKTGVSVDSLAYYNPFVSGDVIPEGSVVRLKRSAGEIPPIPCVNLIDSIRYGVVPTGETAGRGTVTTVAVMMPFGASATLTRQNHLATEFYKGLLLSAYNYSHEYDTPPVQIVAIDTDCRNESAIDDLKSLAPGPNTIVIPADDNDLLDAVARLADKNGMVVLNVLSVKNSDYVSSPNMIQCNISQPLMYDRACRYITNELRDYTPVILKSKDSAADKSGFIDCLKAACDAAGIAAIEVNYGKTLGDADLKMLKDDGKYVFIPASSTAEAFGSISEAVGRRIMDSGYMDKLFGYPEWVTFKDDNDVQLHRLGAIIYSRFFIDDNDRNTKQILDNYEKWYGAPMYRLFPTQAMLGYDTGEMLMKMLGRKGPGTAIDRFDNGRYNGHQSTFRLVHDDGSKGLVNNSLYIVEYLPGDSFIVREY